MRHFELHPRKLAKILRGVSQLSFDRKPKLDFEKKQNWISTKKCTITC
jgi:hypothetical protein